MKPNTSIIKWLRYYLLLIFLTASPYLIAEKDWTAQVRFTHHNEKLGLSSNEVRDIYEGTNNNIWLATANGLNRFDIHRNEIYRHDSEDFTTISSDDLTALAPGLDGKIWIGTKNFGLNLFDPSTGESERIFAGISIGKWKVDELPNNRITHLAVSDNHFLWIGTDNGLAVMNLLSKTIRSIPGPLAKAQISNITVVGSGDVWVGTQKGELFRWDLENSEFQFITKLGAPITTITMDPRLKIWVGTNGAGLYQIREDLSVRRVLDELRDVTSIIADELGDIWVGTRRGLARIDRDAQSLIIYRAQKGEPHTLASDHITKLHFDENRRMIWIATKGGGTSRISLDQYWFPLVKNGEHGISMPSNYISSMAASSDPGYLWIGTESGVFRWQNDTQRIESNLSGLKEMESPYAISLLEDSKKSLWVGTKGDGLIIRNPDGSELKRYNEGGYSNITSIFEDSRGHVWIGSHGSGTFKYLPEQDTFIAQGADPGNKLEFVTSIREDSEGRMWAASTTGLYILDQNSDAWLRAGDVIRADNLNSITKVTCMLFTGRVLWAGTEEDGLFKIDLARSQVTQSRGGRESTTLPESPIVSIAADPNGILWVASNYAISRIEPAQMLIRNFDREDGLQPGQYNRNVVAATTGIGDRSFLLFGGAEGFNPINPSTYPRIIQSPIPMLTDFEYFGKIENPRKGGMLEKPLNSTSLLPIPFDKRNQFAFRFANLDYRFPNRGHFRYRLHPYEPNWIVARTDNQATYRSVPVGRYTFQVESSVDGQKWTENTAKISIHITPPWYQTWWFRLGMGLGIIIGGTFIGRSVLKSRIRAIERREAKLSSERDKAEVALARQLQQGVLLERTSRGFKKGSEGHEDEVFSSPIKYLLEHFDGDIGMIFRVSQNKFKKVESVDLLANLSAENTPAIPDISFAESNQLVEDILASTSAIALATPQFIEDQIVESGKDVTINSVLFMSTRFMDQSNGFIAILSRLQPKKWDAEEITIFNSLSQQFGITIAQLGLSEREREYRERLEEAKSDAEVANRAKSDFLAKMTHELRTPLNSIIGFTEIVQRDGDLSQRQSELIEIVNSSGDHLLDVVNDILDLSKIEAGKIEKSESAFELLPLLKSVYEMLNIKATAKNIGFNFLAKSELPNSVFSDRSKIRQTLINLIGNAIKFTDKGSVTLSVDVDPIGKPEIVNGESRRRLKVTFEIKDTGKGISEEDLPKLFEKYSQTESGLRSAEGTGLGLPIAKSFVNLLGGDLVVESEYGKGTTFRFHIICDEVANSQADSDLAALTEEKACQIDGFVQPEEEPVRILIAEDQPNNRLLLRKILGRAGFELLEAENGQEAVELNESWHPHLILMDEDMPIKRGSEATREILSEETEESPVIVSLTAYALEQAKRSALEAGCKDFLAKPFKTHEIFSVISRHLDIEYTFKDAA